MKLVVLTGGTCGGKSEILKRVKKHFGDKVITIPEVATLLFQGEFPRPKEWTLTWHYSLQRAILDKQYELEEQAKKESRELGINVIVCDRGLLDPAAYIEGGLEELVAHFGVDQTTVLQRYAAIIHLESLATLNPTLYEKLLLTNPYRVETVADSQKQELTLRKVWAKHPNRIHLAGELNDNLAIILSLLTRMLNG